VTQSLDRGREIYEPVFIGIVVSFIEMTEVGLGKLEQFLGVAPVALNSYCVPISLVLG